MTDDEPNPYAPPQVASEPTVRPEPLSAEQVRRRLMVPAVGILLSILINSAFIVWMVMTTVLIVIHSAAESWGDDLQVLAWNSVAILATCIVNYSAAAGAVAMLKLSDYRAAIRGAWFAMVPCGIGCFVALPFAICADWLLRDPRVHAAFSHEKLRFIWRGRS
jgi:hypothetical protein